MITGEDETETPIPEAPYTFTPLKRAQALGDFETLEAHDRRPSGSTLDADGAGGSIDDVRGDLRGGAQRAR